MNSENIVTGVAGFIGSHQAELLLENGEDVTGIDNFHPFYHEKIKRENLEQVRETASKSEGEFTFIEGSINDPRDLNRLPSDPKWVIHHAALSGTRDSFNNPSEYFRVNVEGTSRLLEYLKSVEKLVYTSSSSIYGEVPEGELPVKESREPEPITPYSMSKLQGEKTVKLLSEPYGFDYTIVRPFTVYGPRQRPDEIFTKFTAMILSGEPVTIYGDGTQSRDFTHVEDVTRGVLKAARNGNRTYNLGTGRKVTVNCVVDIIENLVDGEVERKYLSSHRGDVEHTLADIKRARNEIDYRPSRNIEEGVKEAVDWVRGKTDKALI